MIRPLQHLTAAGQLYPAAWKQCDEFRASRGVDLPKWPAWCFVPMAGWYAIVSEGAARLPIERGADVGRLAALGTWRVSQGVYRFDPEVLAALADTVLVGEMPTDVLLRLPQWCLYIETPGWQWMGSEMYGFFVHLEWDVNTERHELRLLIDSEDDLQPQLLHLGPWTVTEAVDRFITEAKKQGAATGFSLPNSEALVQQLGADIQPLLALVLYLCSDEPDIIDRDYPTEQPGRPAAKRTKSGWRLFPPKKPRVWTVGQDLGEAIRRGAADPTGDAGERKGPRPHLRRAHWHGFWTGPRDGERKFRYKWLPPTPVAAGGKP